MAVLRVASSVGRWVHMRAVLMGRTWAAVWAAVTAVERVYGWVDQEVERSAAWMAGRSVGRWAESLVGQTVEKWVVRMVVRMVVEWGARMAVSKAVMLVEQWGSKPVLLTVDGLVAWTAGQLAARKAVE